MTTKAVLWMFFFAFSCVPVAQSQEQEERSVSDPFTEISVGSGIDLYLTQGNRVRILVESDKGILNKIVTRVEGDKLNVYVRNNLRWLRTKTLKVHVTMPSVKDLSVSGGADLRTMNPLSTDQLSVSCSGGGDAYIEVNASDVELTASGGADIRIEGQTILLRAVASGGSDILARELKAQKVVVESSGGSDVTVFAGEEIDASASGGGDVNYYGRPAIKSVHKSGGGDVTEKK